VRGRALYSRSTLTPSTPNAAEKFKGQVTLFFKELGQNLAHGNAPDAVILGHRVPRRVEGVVWVLLLDRIGGRKGADDGILGRKASCGACRASRDTEEDDEGCLVEDVRH